MSKIYYIIIFLLTANILSAVEPVKILSGSYQGSKAMIKFEPFAVAEGDVVEIKLSVQHKRRKQDIKIVQHPGGLIVLDYEEQQNGTYKIKASSDAIYQIFCGGEKAEFLLDVVRYTDKPNVGEISYVRVADTIHASGYVNRSIGENYSITPTKEKVNVGTTIMSETVCQRDFFTGYDIIDLDIPLNEKGGYRDQKLLSCSFFLACDAPSVYGNMVGIIDAGMDAFIKVPDMGSGSSRSNFDDRFKETSNISTATSSVGTVSEVVSIGDELAQSLDPNSVEADLLNKTAFILDTDGLKDLAVNEALNAVGAPGEVASIYNTVNEIPGPTELLKDGVHELLPKVKGTAVMNVYEVTSKVYNDIPSDRKFYIQAAVDYGRSSEGYWDMPSTTAVEGLTIGIYKLDEGSDRRYIIKKNTHHSGYHTISSELGASSYALGSAPGSEMKNGLQIALYRRGSGSEQAFKFKHLGNGRYKIYNKAGMILAKDGSNGGKLHFWQDHEAEHAVWHLLDVETGKTFYPGQSIDTEKLIMSEKGGVINKTLKFNSGEASKMIRIKILKNLFETKAKLLVDAKYQFDDYSDIIRYKKVSTPINTKDFWTSYVIAYDYRIMFKDKIDSRCEEVTKSYYYGKNRAIGETLEPGNIEQSERLRRYKVLTKK